jgi:hypothetical protein
MIACAGGKSWIDDEKGGQEGRLHGGGSEGIVVRTRFFKRLWPLAAVLAAAWLTVAAATAGAQPPVGPPPPPPPATPPEDDFGARDSTVGYIDPALPVNMLRLRFDASYDNNRPTRAEFFWARTRPLGPGVPLPERRVDYQDLATDLEVAFSRSFSVFAELPVRFLHPEVNAPARGLADMNTGFKWAFLNEPNRVATFQLRAYAPTGDVRTGLSTGHASLEPALLLYQRLASGFILEGELRDWIPVGGTDFAGDVLRYGLGLGYDLYRTDSMRVRPVTEFVGWTVLGGKESALTPSGDVLVRNAAGDTIVNVKFGVRAGLVGLGDFYVGYGRVLTGDRWYANTFRLEFRLFY